MQTDKDIALSLIDAMEQLALDSAVLRIVLDKVAGVDSWKDSFDLIKKDARFQEQAHAMFLPLRERVLDAPDLTAAVQRILEGLERTDPEEKGNL